MRTINRRWIRHGSLVQLWALDAVIRCGSVTKAADEMCVAQPTLSGYLAKLGDSLGVDLVTMQGRQLVPTPEALALQQAARDIAAALATCEERLQNMQAPQVRTPTANPTFVNVSDGFRGTSPALVAPPKFVHTPPQRWPCAA